MNYSPSTRKAFISGCPTLSQQLELCLSARQLSILLQTPACISCLQIPVCLGFLYWQTSNLWLHTHVPLCSDESQGTNPSLLKAWWVLRTQISILASRLLLVLTGFILMGNKSPMKRRRMFLIRGCERGTWCCCQRSWATRPAEIWHCRCLAQLRDASRQINATLLLMDTMDRGLGVPSCLPFISCISGNNKKRNTPRLSLKYSIGQTLKLEN